MSTSLTYTTDSIAADIQDLRPALGVESWNLWGTSYGSRIALAMMHDHPEEVCSAILTGVLPPGIGNRRNYAADFMATMERVFSKCKRQQSCAESYSDLEKDIYSAIEHLSKHPVSLDVKVHRAASLSEFKLADYISNFRTVPIMLTEVLFLDIVFRELYTAGGIQGLPDLIHRVANGYYSRLSYLVWDRDIGKRFLVNKVANLTIHCNDGVWYSAEERPEGWTPPPQLKRWGSLFVDPCEQWSGARAQPSASEEVASEVPALLLSGAFDSTTPPGLAEEVAKSLPNSHLYIFIGESHDVRKNPCAESVMQAFLENPRQEPAHDCFAQEEPPVFR